MNAHSWLVRLYPRAWRQRYGVEFEALLEECLHSPLDVLDILLGALDAHLGLAYEMNWRLMNMVNKLRTTLWMVFAGYIGFVIGGLSLYGLVDDSPAVPLMKTSASISAAWTAIQIGSAISLLAVVAGGLPIALTVVRRAFTSSRRDLRLLLVPVVAFLVFVLYVLFLASIANGWLQLPGVAQSVTPDNFPLGNRLLLGGLMLVFVLGAVASTAAVWKILSNTEEESTLSLLGHKTSVRLYEYAYPQAVITGLGMLLMLAATLIFGWLAYSALPGWFAGNFGLLLTNTTLSFGITITIMILSTALAIFGLARGYSAWKGNSLSMAK
jgi:hypothetical protein